MESIKVEIKVFRSGWGRHRGVPGFLIKRTVHTLNGHKKVGCKTTIYGSDPDGNPVIGGIPFVKKGKAYRAAKTLKIRHTKLGGEK